MNTVSYSVFFVLTAKNIFSSIDRVILTSLTGYFSNCLSLCAAVRFTQFRSMAIFAHSSQGSVATYVRSDGIFNYQFTINSLLSLSVNDF